jgi:dephospho-CoA kinase
MPMMPSALDAEAVRTCHWLAGTTFPWDITRALELALLKTFCLPSISGLLQRTGEFEQRPRKRYDDTGLMVAELLRHGPDSPIGHSVIQRMNRIHGAYAISNDDFLYVLSTFVAEPIRWLERYGWRPLERNEQQALFRFWQHVGQRMGIQTIPESLDALMALHSQTEQQLFRTASSNQRIADATLAMLLSEWPTPLQPTVRRLLMAVVPVEVATPLGWRPGSPLLRHLVREGLRLRSHLLNAWQRWFPPKRSQFYSQRPTPSYGPHFQLNQLGPPSMLERLNQPRWQGSQRRIGLTGGIASGKSSVGQWLTTQGIPVLDADAYAHEALKPGSPGAKAVLERYGNRVRQPGQEPEANRAVIDRKALGQLVFADAAERRWLEELVHPLVRARLESALEQLERETTVVLMIPLLFEAGLEQLCSEVWLVDCDECQQQERLSARNQLSHADAQARIEAQWPLARKRRLADVLISNRGTPGAWRSQVEQLLNAPGAPISPSASG